MKNIKSVIVSSFSIKPCIFGIDDLIVAGVITLIGTAVSTAVSSSSSNKQVGATKEANMANMALNQKELGIQQQNADTNQYIAQNNVRQKELANFNTKMAGSSTLKKNMLDVWAGR